jgi:mono/diheme cytochrome c family protein
MRLTLRSLIAFAVMIAASPALAEQDNYVDYQRGKALATAGDCIACHTAPGGQPFAGVSRCRRRSA